jgi:hypothetical protein
MGPIASLFARIGVQADTKAVDRFDLQLKSVLNTAKVAAIGIAGFTAAISKIAVDSFKTASALKQFELETGASAQSLQKWQAVATQAGAGADSIAAGIRSITQNQQNIKLGKGNLSPFLMMGIDPNQDPFKILEEFRQKAQGLAPAMQATMAKNMGLSTDFLRVLQLSNSEFDRMSQGAMFMSPAQINAVDKARESFATIQNAFDHLKNQITASLAPEITKLAKKFIDFVKNNKGFIEGVRSGVQWVMKLAGAIGHVVGTITNVIQKTMGWQGVLLALAGVFAIINAPVMMLAGGLLLLFLIMEDIIAYSEGRGSLIGKFLEASPEAKKAFDGMLGFMSEIAELLGALFSGDMEGYNAMLDKWGVFGQIIKGVGDGLNLVKEIMRGIFTGDWSGYDDVLAKWGALGRTIKYVGETLALAWTVSKAIATGDFSNIEAQFEKTSSALGFKTRKELQEDHQAEYESGVIGLYRFKDMAEIITNMMSRGMGEEEIKRIMSPNRAPGSTGATTINNNATINIDGALDPAATGKEVINQYNRYVNGGAIPR